jgi:hypothetical protein
LTSFVPQHMQMQRRYLLSSPSSSIHTQVTSRRLWHTHNPKEINDAVHADE